MKISEIIKRYENSNASEYANKQARDALIRAGLSYEAAVDLLQVTNLVLHEEQRQGPGSPDVAMMLNPSVG
jgi:hypothetical protein